MAYNSVTSPQPDSHGFKESYDNVAPTRLIHAHKKRQSLDDSITELLPDKRFHLSGRDYGAALRAQPKALAGLKVVDTDRSS